MRCDNIFLIGFMGCGKSSVAMQLRERYGMSIIEMDEEIESREGCTIAEIFERSGEEYFRRLETTLVAELKQMQGKVVSCGGGVVLRKENVCMMKESGKIVLLTASPEAILERLKADESRPILKGKKTVEDIKALMEQRRTSYEAAADFVIDTEGKQIAEICEEIIEKMKKVGE